MTPPEVDQELERLLSVAREATAPDKDAIERVRAQLTPRLASNALERRSRWGSRKWLALALLGTGLGAVALWPRSAPRVQELTTAAPPAPVVQSSSPQPSPDPALEGVPSAAPPPTAPSPARSLEVAPVKSAPVVPKAAASSVATGSPQEELALVRAMQQALRVNDAGQALSLANEHGRRFPRGALVEEREGVRAIAQCQLAKAAERPAILATFAQRFATSPYLARLKAACQ